jgi:hypothetical protein
VLPPTLLDFILLTGFWGESGPLSVSYCIKHSLFSVGPDVLTRGTLIPDNTTVIPTVTDNLFHQGMIEQNLIAVSFEPTTSTSAATTGELTFGATDPSKFTGEINYMYACAAI